MQHGLGGIPSLAVMVSPAVTDPIRNNITCRPEQKKTVDRVDLVNAQQGRLG